MPFELRNVDLARDGKPVLKGISADLRDGTTSLFGPSGSGKSTMLRLLNRLVDPANGTVAYDGRDVRELDVLELRRDACLVPQLPALLAGTVADNIAYGPSLCGREFDLERCLDLAGLDPSFAEREGSKLSVGEQQRVMLARAIALSPQVLLLDEPTSALDQAARTAVEETLVELRERLGISIVLVTHDIEQARRLADWVVRIDAGTVAAQGTPAEVLAG